MLRETDLHSSHRRIGGETQCFSWSLPVGLMWNAHMLIAIKRSADLFNCVLASAYSVARRHWQCAINLQPEGGAAVLLSLCWPAPTLWLTFTSWAKVLLLWHFCLVVSSDLCLTFFWNTHRSSCTRYTKLIAAVLSGWQIDIEAWDSTGSTGPLYRDVPVICHLSEQTSMVNLWFNKLY